MRVLSYIICLCFDGTVDGTTILSLGAALWTCQDFLDAVGRASKRSGRGGRLSDTWALAFILREPRIYAGGVIRVIARKNAQFVLLFVLFQADGANVIGIAFDELLQWNLLQLLSRQPVPTTASAVYEPLDV